MPRVSKTTPKYSIHQTLLSPPRRAATELSRAAPRSTAEPRHATPPRRAAAPRHTTELRCVAEPPSRAASAPCPPHCGATELSRAAACYRAEPRRVTKPSCHAEAPSRAAAPAPSSRAAKSRAAELAAAEATKVACTNKPSLTHELHQKTQGAAAWVSRPSPSPSPSAPCHSCRLFPPPHRSRPHAGHRNQPSIRQMIRPCRRRAVGVPSALLPSTLPSVQSALKSALPSALPSAFALPSAPRASSNSPKLILRVSLSVSTIFVWRAAFRVSKDLSFRRIDFKGPLQKTHQHKTVARERGGGVTGNRLQ